MQGKVHQGRAQDQKVPHQGGQVERQEEGEEQHMEQPRITNSRRAVSLDSGQQLVLGSVAGTGVQAGKVSP